MSQNNENFPSGNVLRNYVVTQARDLAAAAFIAM